MSSLLLPLLCYSVSLTEYVFWRQGSREAAIVVRYISGVSSCKSQSTRIIQEAILLRSTVEVVEDTPSEERTRRQPHRKNPLLMSSTRRSYNQLHIRSYNPALPPSASHRCVRVLSFHGNLYSSAQSPVYPALLQRPVRIGTYLSIPLRIFSDHLFESHIQISSYRSSRCFSLGRQLTYCSCCCYRRWMGSR